MSDLYEVLGVDKTASQDEIKQGYRKKAKQCHPDTEGGDAEEFDKTNKAYMILVDPDTRKNYDETGTTEKPRDDTLEKVTEYMITVFEMVLSESEEPEYKDLFAACKKLIKSDLVQDRQNRAELIEKRKYLRKIAALIKFKPKRLTADVISNSLNDDIKNITSMLATIKEHIKRKKIAYKMFDSSYQFDKQKKPQPEYNPYSIYNVLGGRDVVTPPTFDIEEWDD